MRNTYQVEHERRGLGKDTVVARPLYLVNLSAILDRISAIVNMETVIHEANILRPFENLLRPIRVRRVAGELCKASGEQHKLTLRNSVLIGVTIVELEDLPVETTMAAFFIPTLDLRIPNVLGQVNPGPISELGCGEIVFSG